MVHIIDINKIYRAISEMYETLNLKKQLTILHSVINEESLYGTKERKSKLSRIMDNISWYFKHGEICTYYNSYGFDIIGWRDQSTYLPYRRFRIERNNENYKSRPFHPEDNKTCILRDKIVFSAFFGKMLGAKYVIQDIGRIDSDGTIWDILEHKQTDFKTILDREGKEVFCKKLSGECGDGCYVFSREEDLTSILHTDMRGSQYIIQEKLSQHAILDTINPSCVNTIRLVTVISNRDKTPRVLSHLLRVGINSINDNRATGGLAIGIDEHGVLIGPGIGHHSLMYKHPITGVQFDGIQLPYWKEIIELAIMAHKLIPEIVSIGWDIAITPNGPVLLEGNDNWEICGPQDTAGGLKQKWNELHHL